MPAKILNNPRHAAIRKLCDGVLTSKQIAEKLGESQKYVQKTMLALDLPRRTQGSAFGELNGSFDSGRRIDRDGYVLVSAPPNHPYARKRADRNTGLILEHRLIVEKSIGRVLHPLETVDHIDGLRLHNDPSNLRVFDTNSDHLKATISEIRPNWSSLGFAKMSIPSHLRPSYERVDMYGQMKKNGDARLRQILLAMLLLGKDSIYLLGTRRHLEKAGISDFSRPNLERELDSIYRRYA